MSSNINEFVEPWAHKVVDDFLDNQTYDYLVAEREKFPYRVIDKYKTSGKFGYFFESRDSNVLESISKSVIGAIGNHDLTVVSEIVRCESGYTYPAHSDHPDKLYTIVTYLHPEKSNGTILLSATKQTKQKIEIEWKPNRALIFKQNPNAPHYYFNNTIEDRYTLNTFLTKENIRFATKK